MKGLVSVIIPVYNRQEVLRECVQSVLAQHHQALEIILIDDGSNDDSLALCRTLAEEDSRVKVISMAHGGVSAARNAGIEAAKGEYLFFIDSDDVIHPGLLGALVAGMENSGAGIGGTEVVNVSQRNWHRVNEIIQQDSAPGETDYLTHEEVLRAVFCGTCPLSVIGGVMFRRDLVETTRFRTDLFIGEDFYFIYENLIKGTGAAFLKQKWYFCRLHANNSSWNYGYDGFWTRFFRRRLVWRSEIAFGRTEYANRQKQQGLGIYLMCLQKNPVRSSDSKRIRQVMREHRKELLSGLPIKDKLKYYLSVYMPAVYMCLYRIKKNGKK